MRTRERLAPRKDPVGRVSDLVHPPPYIVAAGYSHCTRGKGRPALSPSVSISCPCLYSLIRSCLHARGRCELSSALAGYMSLLQGNVQSGDPVSVYPLIWSTPLPLLAFLHTWRDFAGSFALNSSEDPVLLHTPICSQRGFCPTTRSLLSSAQKEQ